MISSARLFGRSVYEGDELDVTVLVEYFGPYRKEEEVRIILGVYSGLLMRKGVSLRLLDQCCRTGRLDELIHKKYKHEQLKDYKQFVSRGMVIGESRLYEPTLESGSELDMVEFKEWKSMIIDEDHYVHCNRED